VNAELDRHPIARVALGTECVNTLRSKHAHEKLLGFVKIGHRHTDVVDAVHARDALRHDETPLS
jgi:hypothetical protein